MSRATTHEWACVRCGVRMQGRETSAGVKPTNAPPSGEVRPCLCRACEDAERRELWRGTWREHA